MSWTNMDSDPLSYFT